MDDTAWRFGEGSIDHIPKAFIAWHVAGGDEGEREWHDFRL
jgi:hypothetical protein